MSECDDRRNKIVGRSLWKREDKSASTEIVDALEIVKHGSIDPYFRRFPRQLLRR